MLLKKKFIKNISDLSNIELKNISKKNSSPFMSYEFLDAIETSGSASSSSGWRPYHIAAFKNEALNGFIPLYLKNNSQG